MQSDDDIENRPDLNTGTKWSEMDLLDLANCVRLNDHVEEIASFMCRSRREVRKKLAELGRSGELIKWVERAEAAAVPETDEPEDDEAETDDMGFGENTEDPRS
jgi:hypothetical protein